MCFIKTLILICLLNLYSPGYVGDTLNYRNKTGPQASKSLQLIRKIPPNCQLAPIFLVYPVKGQGQHLRIPLTPDSMSTETQSHHSIPHLA